MGVKTSQKIIMKLIVALSAVLALVSGDQCEDCTAVVTTLATYLTTEESISRQTDILLAEVCPGAGLPWCCGQDTMTPWVSGCVQLRISVEHLVPKPNLPCPVMNAWVESKPLWSRCCPRSL